MPKRIRMFVEVMPKGSRCVAIGGAMLAKSAAPPEFVSSEPEGG